MNLDESNYLARRVSDLEGEVRALRRRVAALEGRDPAAIPSTALEVQPLEPTALEGPPLTTAEPVRVASSPPPLPTSAKPAPVAASWSAGTMAGAPVSAAPVPAASVVEPAPEVAIPIAERPAPAHAAPFPVTPPPTPPPVVPTHSFEPADSPLRDLLATLGLLPPTGQLAGEAGIGAWWATRIGALILVIGVVFFGIYVSLSTPPWVRLMELSCIAVGMTAGGLWIERRLARLGAVVMGAGLALCYFATFAAYAVPAVKVVESVGLAAFLQAAAVTAIGVVALWRRASTVATMAVLLGFTSAFFSYSAGFDDFAIAAGLGLAAMAVFFRRREGWGAPVLISGGLVHVLTTLVAFEFWETEVGQRSPLFAFSVVGAAWGLHFLSVVMEGAVDESGRIATLQRWLQAVNTSLAVMAGFAAALAVMDKDQLSGYFFGAGAVLIAAAAWAWRVVPRDGIFGMFAVKAASLIALGVIVEWDARTRWVALAVQAAVIMAAAVRTRRVSLAAASGAAWLVSLLFFGSDVEGLAGQFISGAGVAVVLYLAGSAALLGWIDRWARGRDAGAPGHTALTWILGTAAAAPVVIAAEVAWVEPWLAVACVVLSLTHLGIARVLRTAVPAIGAVVAMLAAHGVVQVFDEAASGLAWLWAGAGLVAARSLVMAWWAGRRGSQDDVRWLAAAGVLAVLGLAAVTGALLQTIELRPALGCGALLALGMVVGGARLGRSDFAGAGLLGMPIVWALYQWHEFTSVASRGPSAWLWLPAAAVPLALAVPRVRAMDASLATALRALAAATGVLFVWAAAERVGGPAAMAWSLAGAGAIYLLLGRLRSCAPAQVAASALFALGPWHFVVDTHGWSRGDAAWPVLVAVVILLLALSLAPLVRMADGRRTWPERFGRPWRIAHAAVAAVGLARLATLAPAAWAVYGSVVWAVGGLALFLIGLLFRARSHRIAGLLSLGLCIPRVFIHDIESTKYRIAAFVVLGVLLLIVGFSYQKFRHWIEVDPGTEPEGTSGAGADLKRPGA